MNKIAFRFGIFTFILILIVGCRTEPKTDVKSNTTVDPYSAVVTTRLRAEPGSLNSTLTYQGIDLQVINKLYYPLVEFDPQDLKLKPYLAKSMAEVNQVKDGAEIKATTYTYEIKEDATWSDGKPVLASDYIFTLKALMNPKLTGAAAAYRTVLNAISKVEVDPSNPKKMTVTIAPFNFRGEYTSGGFQILPAHIFDSNGLLKDVDVNDLLNKDKAEKLANSNPKLQEFATIFNTPKYSRETVVGSGPYDLKEWVTGEKLVLEKKKNWWGDKYATSSPYLVAYAKELIYKIIPDEAPLVAMLQNNTLDAAYQIANTTFLDLKKDDKVTANYHFYNPGNLSISYIGLNGNRPKLKDKKVRQALAYLMDTDEVINTVKQGMAEKIASVVPKDLSYSNKKLAPRSLDIKKASQLLAEAGWTDSNNNGIVDKVINGKREELTIEYLVSAGSQVSNDIAVIFKNGAKKAGVDINVQANERKTNNKKIRSKDFDMYAGAFGADLDFYDFYQYWHTTSRGNRFGFGNAETDKIIEEIRNTTDANRRNQLYGQIQEIMYEEQPVLFLYRTQDCMLVNKRFEGIQPTLKSPGYFEETFKLVK